MHRIIPNYLCMPQLGHTLFRKKINLSQSLGLNIGACTELAALKGLIVLETQHQSYMIMHKDQELMAVMEYLRRQTKTNQGKNMYRDVSGLEDLCKTSST